VLSGVRDANSAPPGTQAEVVDIGKPESIDALAERLRARNQRLDALVNNAGVYQGPAREIWNVNVLGPLRLTRALEPLLAPNARVVMVTSGLGQLSAQPATWSSVSQIPSCHSLRSSAWPKKPPMVTAGARPRSTRWRACLQRN